MRGKRILCPICKNPLNTSSLKIIWVCNKTPKYQEIDNSLCEAFYKFIEGNLVYTSIIVGRYMIDSFYKEKLTCISEISKNGFNEILKINAIINFNYSDESETYLKIKKLLVFL